MGKIFSQNVCFLLIFLYLFVGWYPRSSKVPLCQYHFRLVFTCNGSPFTTHFWILSGWHIQNLLSYTQMWCWP